ncbi:MAG: hypothetical protein Q9195_006148 [Heterodermia aff. obscurata]
MTGAVAATVVLTILTLSYTRYVLSSEHGTHLENEGQAHKIPYWIPWAFDVLTGVGTALKRTSVRSNHGVFSLQILGRTWNVVTDSALLAQVYQHADTCIDSSSAQWSLLCRVFGADKRFKQAFLNTRVDMRGSPGLKVPHQSDPSVLLCTTIQRIQLQIPHLVSFSEGSVDQSPWERSSHAELVDDDAVEVDLFTLVTTFAGHAILPSLLGSEFLDAYPGTFNDLRKLDSSMKYLLLGLPRWFPMQSLASANFARHRLDNSIDSFHRALDKVAAGSKPDLPWRDMSDVSQEMKDRCALWRKHDLPPAVKGPLDLQLLWA